MSGHEHDQFSFRHFMYKLNWHFFAEPDGRLIESLILQLVFLITTITNCYSLFSIIKHTRNHNGTAKHWSVSLSKSCLFLSILIGGANFLLLIYQQDGKFFDNRDWLCKCAIILLSIFVFSLPISIYLSIKGYFEWKTIYNNFINSKYGILNATYLKWIEIPTGTSADTEMRFLVAIKKENNIDSINKNDKTETENETLLLNETTNQVINENRDNNKHGDLNKTINYQIAFAAHKSCWKFFLFGLFMHLIICASVQYKNWNQEKQSLYQWGYRFSRLLNTHDLALAKYQRSNGVRPNEHEMPENLDLLEHWARTTHQHT